MVGLVASVAFQLGRGLRHGHVTFGTCQSRLEPVTARISDEGHKYSREIAALAT